jgi:uncharacterized protein YhaN
MSASEVLCEEFLKAKAVMVSGSADPCAVSALRKSHARPLKAIARGFLKAQKQGKIHQTTSHDRAVAETRVGMGILASFFLSALVKALISEFVRWALSKMELVQTCSAQFSED